MFSVPHPRRLAWLAAALSLAGSAPAVATSGSLLGPSQAHKRAACGYAAAQDDQLAFSLATTTGQTLLGPLVALGADGTVRVAGDQSAPIKVDNWITLRRGKKPLPPHPRGPQIVLTTGDRIPLAEKAAVQIVDNQLHCQPQDPLGVNNGTLQVPLSWVVLIWLGGPDDVEEPTVLLRQLLSGSRKKDLVLLRNSDRVEGNVLSLDSATNCSVELAKKHIDLPWSNVGAVAFSTELLAGNPPAGIYYHLVLANCGRLSVLSPSLAKGEETLTCTTLFAAAAQVPIDQVIALDVRHGAAVYLSDLKPRQFEHTSFVGTMWPLVVNGSVTGGELRLSGSTFDKGLGMHAESRVVYDLDGKYRWFEAMVGLDPEHGKKGRVRVRVLLDGKEKDLGWNKELTASDGALMMRVDVNQGRALTLEVLFGGFGDVQTHVNWVDARFIKN